MILHVSSVFLNMLSLLTYFVLCIHSSSIDSNYCHFKFRLSFCGDFAEFISVQIIYHIDEHCFLRFLSKPNYTLYFLQVLENIFLHSHGPVFCHLWQPYFMALPRSLILHLYHIFFPKYLPTSWEASTFETGKKKLFLFLHLFYRLFFLLSFPTWIAYFS